MHQLIYLTLHGETEWNREHRFQGRLDSPLTPMGIDQAAQMGATLGALITKQDGWEVISSTLPRARTTAGIICNELGIKPESMELDARLAEIDVGSWSGLTREEIDRRWPGALDGFNRYDWIFQSPDGESLEDLSRRLEAWLYDTRKRPQLIVVAHGIVSRILRGLYAGLPRDEMLALEISRTAVFRLTAGKIERIDCGNGANLRR